MSENYSRKSNSQKRSTNHPARRQTIELPPRGPVEGLIYWRDLKRSGIVFGTGLSFLLALCYCSAVSVIAYVTLAALLVAVSFRCYKMSLQALNKQPFEHPFRRLLEHDLKQLIDTRGKQSFDIGWSAICSCGDHFARLLLVDDMIDSLKFAIALYCLTYVGQWFNAITCLLIGFVSLFTFPKIYEMNKTQIDININFVLMKMNEIGSKIRAFIPVGLRPIIGGLGDGHTAAAAAAAAAATPATDNNDFKKDN